MRTGRGSMSRNGNGSGPLQTTEEECFPKSTSYFENVSVNKKYFRRFQTYGRNIVVNLKKPDDNSSLKSWLNKTMTKLCDEFTRDYNIDDYISSENFANGDAWLSFRKIPDLNHSDFSDMIFQISQNNSGFDINVPISFSANIVKSVYCSG